ncbi:MAG: hypothetical protein OXH45_12770 [Gammaproteobacteria bacterium]|nr:hypothetical protein [Gammaproteobacteria bacterium]
MLVMGRAQFLFGRGRPGQIIQIGGHEWGKLFISKPCIKVENPAVPRPEVAKNQKSQGVLKGGIAGRKVGKHSSQATVGFLPNYHRPVFAAERNGGNLHIGIFLNNDQLISIMH